jgi:hypothetical protein
VSAKRELRGMHVPRLEPKQRGRSAAAFALARDASDMHSRDTVDACGALA